MKNQNEIDYCQYVKNENVILKKSMFTIPIKDDNSPLISLSNEHPEFIFEPSFFQGYKYLVREEIVKKLHRINSILIDQSKILVIRSAWRSYEHQKALRTNRYQFLSKLHNTKTKNQINAIVSYFIASETQSMHATGGAVDALIFDLNTGNILDFGVNKGYNIDLGVKCYPYHPDISFYAKQNRKLLIELFEGEGFVVDLKEFWHFDYGNVAWAASKNLNSAMYGPIFDKVNLNE